MKMYVKCVFALLMIVLLPIIIYAEEPALPSGLSGSSEPGLPTGLGGPAEPGLPAGLGGGEPSLPTGIGSGSVENTSMFFDDEDAGLPITGFWEVLLGTRIQDDRYEQEMPAGETRLQMEYEKTRGIFTLNLTADLLYDVVLSDKEVDLETGRGAFDLREAKLNFSPIDSLDVSIGRQTLTWGTGDLLFINDLFPKDWNSFFIGRNDEYLKAPSDAVKLSLFNNLMNIDFVYTPKFDSDRYIDGRRISYYNANLDSLAGRNAVVRAREMYDWFREDEFAVRLYKNFGPYEFALYGYDGYWKSPNGQDPATWDYIFPELSVYGFSLRGPFRTGIANIEAGLYKSREDSSGDNMFVRNSEFRLLLGYEQELKKNLTGAFQYYLENMLDYDAYKGSMPAGTALKDEFRHVLTFRITKLMMNQNLQLSLFNYYSPSDTDGYFRPKLNYKINDFYTVETGLNIFYGNSDKTFFGQFEDNSNIYASMRYSY